jgi:two-component system, chemotaxis family, sensor kinase CheA
LRFSGDAGGESRKQMRRGMDEIVKDFLIESNENLDRLDQELVQVESEPSSKELLASIFRTIHTIKGSCGFLGFANLEKVSHAGESLLSLLREGKLSLTAEVTSGLLAMVDAVRHMLAEIQASQRDGDSDYPELREKLKRLQSEGSIEAQADAVPIPGNGEFSLPETAEIRSGIRICEISEAPGEAPPEGVTTSLPKSSKAAAPAMPQPNVESSRRDSATDTVRLGVNLLDKLMNLVGELVLARNQLLQFSNATQDAAFHAVSQRMNLIASELQEEVMKTRMQPIGNIWNKFPRTVRDLALGCGKEVRLDMEGQNTELDRTIIEAIKDPLTHLVRNSIDHGIELPTVRRQNGKESCGCLMLRAFHEGGQVNIEVMDDGAGLNPDRIRHQAIVRGLITPQQAGRMPERDMFNLIFLPGFSTAQKVTNVSGRGVGMDVVKTNVEKIGGTVEVQSAAGKGTTVRVKIPLTLAIVPALIVSCARNRFALPQVSLLELVRLEAEDKERCIEMVYGAPVYRLRGRLLPLVYLSRELQLAPSSEHKDAVNILILQAEGRQFGLVVDEIIDTQEIVVKPLGKQLKGIAAYSGATIMGDGGVALILDVLGLAQRAKVVSEAQDFKPEERHSEVRHEAAHASKALLLAENGKDGRVAIPLSLVARLEEFPATAVEQAGGQEVMQYRGQIIPLLRLSRALPAREPAADIREERGSIQVVIYSESGRTVGLVVDHIVDVIDEYGAVETMAARTGVTGSFVAQRRVTDLLDIPTIVRAGVAGLFNGRESQSL